LGSGPHTPTQFFWEYPPGVKQLNNLWMKNSRDLILGEVVYIPVYLSSIISLICYRMVTIFWFDHTIGESQQYLMYYTVHVCLNPNAINMWTIHLNVGTKGLRQWRVFPNNIAHFRSASSSQEMLLLCCCKQPTTGYKN